MTLIEFTERSGNKVWINNDTVEAVGTVYSDGTETGENPEAQRLTYVLLTSGDTIHLDHTPEVVVGRLQPYV